MNDYDAQLKRKIRIEKKLQKLEIDRPRCWMCGEDSPTVRYERHHIAGRANSDVAVLLCQNCHAKVSDAQEDLIPDLRSAEEQRDPVTRLVAVLQGASILLIVLAIVFAGWAEWCAAAALYLNGELKPQWWSEMKLSAPK